MNSDRALRQAYPGSFFLAPDVPSVAAFLSSRGWLNAGEIVQAVDRAGEGNMNCVMRVSTSQRSVILKQSRPWVEKYPNIAAPWDRALVEAHFYCQVEQQPAISGHLPTLLGFDSDEHLMMLEDLGDAQDFTFLYSDTGAMLEQVHQNSLTGFLIALHTSFRSPGLAASFSNSDMRALNHEHIFALPIRENNGLDLDSITPGLASLAVDLSADRRYCSVVRSLGERYINSSGVCLIHGDYFPGSWIKAGEHVYVIDPEFCFYGLPEWDLGVMAAHLYLSGHPRPAVDALLSGYATAAPLEHELALQFSGVEIMRRLIGVAQLPVRFGLHRKAELLALSKELVLKNQSV